MYDIMIGIRFKNSQRQANFGSSSSAVSYFGGNVVDTAAHKN
jgi:hypothetical protein